ncbi:MAG: hypothetical protein ABSD29_26035 [Verrucomicrobiota bacterium]
MQANQFGFNITGSSNLVIVVEACTNLDNPVWTPLQTFTLTGSPVYFSDPQWTNYPARFYRLRLREASDFIDPVCFEIGSRTPVSHSAA